jgi:hypothetical protein
MRGWRLGALQWTGEARRLEVRRRGRVSRVRAHYVWSPEEPLGRTLQMAGSPAIITRKAWGADERIRRASPRFAKTLTTAVVHHTAGGERRPAQSAAVVRGPSYHVRGTAGTTSATTSSSTDSAGLEGRYGGVERNVMARTRKDSTPGPSISVIARAMVSRRSRGRPRAPRLRMDVAHVDLMSTRPSSPEGTSTARRALFPLGDLRPPRHGSRRPGRPTATSESPRRGRPGLPAYTPR